MRSIRHRIRVFCDAESVLRDGNKFAVGEKLQRVLISNDISMSFLYRNGVIENHGVKEHRFYRKPESIRRNPKA